MADFPLSAAVVLPLHVHTDTVYACGWEQALVHGSGAPGAVTWVANLVAYMPFALPFPYPLKRFFWMNGSTVTSTNVDCGIYTQGGQKLASTGSTAMSGASAIQYAASTTLILLQPEIYYLAWTCNGTTSRGAAIAGTAARSKLMGLLEETTGVFGLPATMTPVTWARAWGPSYVGMTRTASGF